MPTVGCSVDFPCHSLARQRVAIREFLVTTAPDVDVMIIVLIRMMRASYISHITLI